MSDLWQDIKYGARRLRNDAGFTILAAFTIALGIGANTTIFTAIDALLFHPFPFRNAERLVAVQETFPNSTTDYDLVAPANFFDIKDANAVFEKMSAVAFWASHFTENETPERVNGTQVSTEFFSMLGAEAALGRTFVADDLQPGNNFVVVISDGLWKRRFGAQRDVVGRTTHINNRAYTVIGVMPPSFAYPRGGTEVWTPFISESGANPDRSWRFLQVIALLKDGVTIQAAQSQMNTIGQTLAQQYPDANNGRGLHVSNLFQAETIGPRPYILLALGAVGLVLLLSCVNVAMLLLLRASTVEKEIAIRAAIGATRVRVVKGLLVESVLLSLVGSVFGLLGGVAAVYLLRTGMPPTLAKGIAGWDTLGLNWTVVAFVLLLSLVIGVVFGILPALHASHQDPGKTLNEAGRSSAAARGRNFTRNVLVVSEIALAIVLLVGAGLMMRSFLASLNAELGFKPERLLTFQIDLPFSRYRKPEETITFYDQLLASLKTKPGVIAAGAVNGLPVTFTQPSEGFTIEGKENARKQAEDDAFTPVVMPGYFNAAGITLLHGRDFMETDTLDSTFVVIISDALAQRKFSGQNPLGKRLMLTNDPRPREIIGIVGNIKHEPFVTNAGDQPELAIYMPHKQNPWHLMNLVIRTASNDPGSIAFVSQGEVQRLDKQLPVYNLRTMNEVIADSLAPQRLTSVLFSVFGFIALVLSAVGLYAVVSYSVVQRTNEIGIRMALGAQRRDVLYLIMKQALAMLIVGISIGLVAAYFGARLMTSILFGIAATDAVTFVGIPLLLTLIALVACYVPARRATKLDPLLALRRQ
ncbi:MAG TPA: ABC transporter permease [Pyrinomonadaceae bacterium]|nr:ABC transporter permease [Pyrinomonadaceae bacterium]